MFDSDALHVARERDGAAAEDRPSEVDEILEPKERVGFENELPLLDRDYEGYPEGDDLLRPSEGDTLRALTEHEMVGSVEDLADELHTTEDKVEKAADLHGVSPPVGDRFDITVETNRLDALLGNDYPRDMVDSDNPITVAILYVEKGLSVEEVADVFENATDKHTVREADVRQVLVDARILSGETTTEAEYRRKQSRGEINHSHSGGITIDAT